MNYPDDLEKGIFVHRIALENCRTLGLFIKDNPDLIYNANWDGYWVRPRSKTWTLLSLTGAMQFTSSTYTTNIDWKIND